MNLAPVGDGVVIVAADDRPAYRQQQDLAQRMGDPMRFAGVLDLRKMSQKQPKACRLQLERLIQVGKDTTKLCATCGNAVLAAGEERAMANSESRSPIDLSFTATRYRVNPGRRLLRLT